MSSAIAISEKLIVDGKLYRDQLFEMIEGAQSEILISSYIFESDVFGNQLLEKLLGKAEAGVQVKLCLDGFGSWAWLKNLERSNISDQFQVKIFHPLPWPFSRFSFLNLPRLDRLFVFLYHFNVRNHQKLLVFDKTKAMVGSRNIHQEGIEWRETSLVFTGVSVVDALGVFSNLWSRSYSLDFKRKLTKAFSRKELKFKSFFSNHFFNLRRFRNNLLIDKLESAKREILITTPYFLPPPKIINRICKKAREVVEVALLLPNCSDVKLSKAVAEVHYDLLIKSGVKIYEYNASILHAKTIVIDDWALVGSSNFNRRSFVRDLEVDYSPQRAETVQSLKEQFKVDLVNASLIIKKQKINLFYKVFLKVLTRFFYSWF